MPRPSGSHTHKVADIDGLVEALAEKVDITDVYSKAEVDVLLTGKSDSGHKHNLSEEQEYGVDPATVGPANSTPETSGTQATTSNYQSIITAASPGEMILLHAGTYPNGVTVPPGVTIKPFNGDLVTVTGNWKPSPNSSFDGIYFNDPATRLATVRVESATPLTGVKYLYCDIQGGATEGMRVAGNVEVVVGHTRLDGGQKRHSFKSHHKISGTASGFSPSFRLHHCEISHARRGPSTIGQGDLAQFEGWKNGLVEFCLFHDEPHENAVDIKQPYTSGIFILRRNLFDHATIANASILDHSGGPKAVSDTRIYDNKIVGDNGGACVTLGGDNESNGYTDFRRNLIADALGRIAFWNLTDAKFNNNQIGPADMEFNVSSGLRPVSGLDVSGNSFNGTDLNVKGTADYAGTGNTKTGVTGGDWTPIG